jgi:hypothetical protein
LNPWERKNSIKDVIPIITTSTRQKSGKNSFFKPVLKQILFPNNPLDRSAIRTGIQVRHAKPEVNDEKDALQLHNRRRVHKSALEKTFLISIYPLAQFCTHATPSAEHPEHLSDPPVKLHEFGLET